MSYKAVIFDMDGVVIDSEPFWREAEINVFGKIGIPMTEDMCREMKGVKIDNVVKYWYSIHKWQTPDIKQVEKEIVEEFLHLVRTKGKLINGFLELVVWLKSRDIKTGLATSSHIAIMNEILKTLNIEHFFEVAHSAESEKEGKPAPDVFLGAARRLDIKPENCIAVEDSTTGIKAAKAAGMFTIAYPEAIEFELDKYNIADLKVKSLLDIIKLSLFD
jgi:mannitol-1-/sugar-/sorbitol-6-/2-deoxyglucose-6-phosphatase